MEELCQIFYSKTTVNCLHQDQDTRYKIQDTRYKIQDTRYKIQDTRYKMTVAVLSVTLEGWSTCGKSP